MNVGVSSSTSMIKGDPIGLWIKRTGGIRKKKTTNYKSDQGDYTEYTNKNMLIRLLNKGAQDMTSKVFEVNQVSYDLPE